MKYGKTERISGVVILLALAAILIPWLMSEPAPRDEPPQPSFTIEEPVDVERHDVAAPEKPESVKATRAADDDATADSAVNVAGDEAETVIDTAPIESATGTADTTDDATAGDDAAEVVPASPEPSGSEKATDTADRQDANQQDAGQQQADQQSQKENDSDPIAALMEQGDDMPRAVDGGDWAVQVGSFGQADNARRLKQELEDKGFSVYTRARDNDLTTVLVGPFARSKDGEAAMSLIKQRANQQGLLIRVDD